MVLFCKNSAGAAYSLLRTGLGQYSPMLLPMSLTHQFSRHSHTSLSHVTLTRHSPTSLSHVTLLRHSLVTPPHHSHMSLSHVTLPRHSHMSLSHITLTQPSTGQYQDLDLRLKRRFGLAANEMFSF